MKHGKKAGIGRAVLQAGIGGLMTGNASGALAGGSTSLAAPYLNEAEEKLGSTGTLINALGGAAIGYATGGSGGAVVGAKSKNAKAEKSVAKKQQ